ncbi:MAG: ketoacyl-synthetase C-terminal extension domain-containing protein, partial [Bacteroidota bacterium]
TNIGHALSAAGVAGLIKVLMAMKHVQLAPSLHFNTPNEHINFADSPFYVNTALKEWKPVNGKRIAAISSFGFSGTNAHLVLEDYPVKNRRSDNKPPAIIPLSAKSEKQLRIAVSDLRSYLVKKDYQLDQISYTLQTGRRGHEYRVALMAWDVKSLVKLCSEFLEDKSSDQIFRNKGELTSRSKNSSSDLNTIAKNWIDGQVVDWKSLYNSIPQKVSLPTYPFE